MRLVNFFWQETVDHIFVQEMVKNRLSTKAFLRYLNQDYTFFRHFSDLSANTYY
ncbi:hypothetical protein [Suttonella ornithocola]|uniref:hypothetical protein n=1 Tax=Suttonella ornithocola TaxID=279832 RepID=UPI000A010452